MLTIAAMVFPFVVMCNGAEVTLNETIEAHGSTVMVYYTAFRGELQVNQMQLRPMTTEQWAEDKDRIRPSVVARYQQIACM